MSKATIIVEGHGPCEVVENLGYQHSVGKYGKAVLIEGRERIVSSYKAKGPWAINRPVVDVSGLRRALRGEQP